MRRRTPLEWTASLVSRRPRLVVVIWVLVLGALASQGAGLAGQVSSSPVFVDGTEAEREHGLGLREFGADAALIVMLQGPKPALDRQGPELAERLDKLPNTLVNSPWDAGKVIDGLRPEPDAAGLVVSVGQSSTQTSGEALEQTERAIERTLAAPVRASIAGGLPLGYAMRTSADDAAKAGELVAIPALLIVLLFVCRSLIAAAMPVAIGTMVVGASQGVLAVFAETVRVDSFAIGAISMLGLALGVDYSLLVVSRFREEREREGDPAAAIERTVLATGRSVIPAGCGLVLAMLVSSQILPSAVISSVALAVTAASVLSVLSALFATPAILLLANKHLDRWSLPPRKRREGLLPRWTQRLSRRPGMVIGVGFLLFLCSVWAFTLKTHVAAIGELPPNNSSRIQHEAVQQELGTGWIAPLEVVMKTAEGPVTTPRRLEALTKFQRQVEADPGVATMAGFDRLARGAERFEKVGPGLEAQQRGIVRIDRGIAKIADGSAATVSGFVGAHDGAEQIDAAIGQTYRGSGSIADGLRSTAAGSERLNGGLERVGEGSGDLTDGAERSSSGAARIAKALVRAEELAGESAGSSRVLKSALSSGEQSLFGMDETVRASGEQLDAAQVALQRMTAGRGDPQYAAALAAVEEARQALGVSGGESAEPTGVQAGIEEAQGQFSLGIYLAEKMAKNGRANERGIGKLAEASQQLDRGLRRLVKGSSDLSDGIARLSDGGAELSPGLRKLTDASERLASGLGQIGTGTTELAGGLARGVQGSSRLTTGLRQLESGSGRLAGPNGEGNFAQLNERSPGLFKSGYFFLAGLDGGSQEQQDQAAYLVNLGNGGTAARMMIIPRNAPEEGEARETQERLRELTAELAREANAEVLIGGIGPAVMDLDSHLRGQAPLARVVLSIVTILILLFVTRSLVLALLAAALNLITVSATFGLMSLLFDQSLLGGPGYIDTVILPASIILIFGLAIDYEVFIFARMREEYLRTGSASLAISEGLERSASVVTGAALIMIAAFLAFSVSPLPTLRAFGVALAIAVFIDAFLIRFVIVPAVMRALGERSWWIPRWLDRLLPGGARPLVAAEGE